MTEITKKEEIEEKLINVDDKQLGVRINIIIDKLMIAANNLRGQIDESLPEDELLEDDLFKQWVVVNEIITAAQNNEDFSRMLYFLYEECDRNLIHLLSFYDIEFETNEDNNISKVTLITIEEEQSE
tara:strand:+ start:5411 stop:5791 length:381 start_codon:yes stop_codon:yes gene_type:complete